MFAALAQALAAGLSIWNNKERQKYVDELIRLRKEYYEETSKPDSARDDAVLDRIEFSLRNLAVGFASSVTGPDAAPKS